MATQVQIRKGTTAQHASFTGAVAELTVDTDKKTVVVHDGTTAGGVPLMTNTRTETVTGTKTFSNAVLTTSSFTNNPTLSGGTANGVLYLNGSKVATSGSALVFDGSNLGLGVTPSAWSVGKAIEINAGGNAVWGLGTNSLQVVSNYYYDGSYRYKANGYANRYDVGSSTGIHAWFTAPSGTAGNAITFTQAMTLDASGNLVVGSTTALGKLSVWSAANGDILAGFRCAGTGTQRGLYISGDNSTGVVKLDVTGSAGGTLAFATGGTETARIDSSGNLLVGTTSSSYTTGTGFKVVSPVAGHWDPAVVTSGNSANYSCWDIYSTGAGAYRFYVTTTGVINATSTTITAISDQRLKENVRDIDTGLDAVLALKPRRFDWKEGKGQDKKNAAGFIAQEFETVFPNSVGTSKAGEDGIEYKNICHEELIPTLVKAIQEQQAQIAQLTQRLADAGIA